MTAFGCNITGNPYCCSNMQPPELCIPNPMLAHSYVPIQHFVCVYPPAIGLCRGTIFPELDRPYGADPEYLIDA